MSDVSRRGSVQTGMVIMRVTYPFGLIVNVRRCGVLRHMSHTTQQCSDHITKSLSLSVSPGVTIANSLGKQYEL